MARGILTPKLTPSETSGTAARRAPSSPLRAYCSTLQPTPPDAQEAAREPTAWRTDWASGTLLGPCHRQEEAPAHREGPCCYSGRSPTRGTTSGRRRGSGTIGSWRAASIPSRSERSTRRGARRDRATSTPHSRAGGPGSRALLAGRDTRRGRSPAHRLAPCVPLCGDRDRGWSRPRLALSSAERRELERATGLEPATFSLGSWNGFGDARGTSAVRLCLKATCAVKRGQEMTGSAAQNARTSADGSDRGSDDGALGRRSTPLQAVGLTMGQYGSTGAG
jgi:hypothetical protein